MKPRIIVMSKDDSDTFSWMSDGWNHIKIAHTQKAQHLFSLANKCIREAKDVPDAIARLEEAGFEIERS